MPDPISYADIEWKENVPCSRQFDDIYFSRAGGEAETKHVFIDGNNLSQRFSEATNHFTIIETGFGTGLNFLVTAALWSETAPKDATLHFISTEKFPLSPDDMEQALSSFPQFEFLSNALLKQYPPLCSGFHRLSFENHRIQLTLLYGDIKTTLPQLKAKADAWYLDGFAPSKNTDMWNSQLFSHIARLSKENTTLATYSAAGAVKRSLEDIGFSVQKPRGFGHKREMITAKNAATQHAPFLHRHKKAIVIGAGLAGCFASISLAKRGFNVTLIERHAGLCGEASGNPSAILQPSITAPDDLAGRLHMAGFLYSVNLLKNFTIPFSQTGALHFHHKREGKTHLLPENWLKTLTKEEAASLLGRTDFELPDRYYFLSTSCYFKPTTFVETILDHYKGSINTVFKTEIKRLEKTDNEWFALDEKDDVVASAPYVIIASANDVSKLSQTNWLPLQPVRGQLTYISANSVSRHLDRIICHESGYVLPADESGMHVAGATYEPFLDNQELLALSHQRNVEGFENIMGNAAVDDINALGGRVSFRCASKDRMPFIGPVSDINLLRKSPRSYRTKQYNDYTLLPCHEGLFVSTAHGSKGLSTVPLAGEIIASYITGEPLPLEADILKRIHPSRWPAKQLKQGKAFT